MVDKHGMLTRTDDFVMKGGYQQQKYFRCVCDCGGEKYVRPNDLKSGKISSCGCATVRRVVSLFGQRFGLLEVISPEAKRVRCGSSLKLYWECLCHGCDRKKWIMGGNLKNGNHQSCGCAKKGLVRAKLSHNFESPVGVPSATVSQRIRKGWSLHDALTIPLRGRRVSGDVANGQELVES